MAEPLKNHFGQNIPRIIAEKIATVYPGFDTESFIIHTLDGYEPLNLMDRGRKIAHSLHQYLPDDYQEAITILIDSLDVKTKTQQVPGPIASFLFLPHTFFVALYGLSHFEASMRAQYMLTQRFTAEYSIRPFLEQYTHSTLERLTEWTSDPSIHVRRLVSEGTRPRLPWAPRLQQFRKNPRPVLELLEQLKDDSSEYVRRSVANNLNDIGKDHPKLLFGTVSQWMKDATEDRQKLIRHALRSAVKRGDPAALSLLGFGDPVKAMLEDIQITPHCPEIGGSVQIAFTVKSTHSLLQRVMVDFCIHYVKADGRTSVKVFKLKEINLAPNGRVQLSKKVSLAEMTTRKHYPGKHKVEALLNGLSVPLDSFLLS
ncbi:MAG: DNA alkylation repair protein [Balneolales bacterium]